ncbi:ParB N-terminal domain-containing protein [Thermoactinomyces sp. DSM 45892]|uniref:ParB N-terminal domain-containing protein n=1 Tax=Thermoactinomyces sp. DSM 45892 TaxID=1882753 RepID=UPI00089BB15E|nr:ParB N-terminal domain-containing protein [Thermoactinomyces sp. DSM 45892]SDY87845.1 ParB-like nuclease domain-containing protein [Thermoactinomyces sp. DSM 45892]
MSTKSVVMIELDRIQIPYELAESKPREEKLERIRQHIQKSGELDEYIVVHQESLTLVDGYIRYLVARELGFTFVPVRWGNLREFGLYR